MDAHAGRMIHFRTASAPLKKYALHFFNPDCIGTRVDEVLIFPPEKQKLFATRQSGVTHGEALARTNRRRRFTDTKTKYTAASVKRAEPSCLPRLFLLLFCGNDKKVRTGKETSFNPDCIGTQADEVLMSSCSSGELAIHCRKSHFQQCVVFAGIFLY
jgi:hypothetical protein